MKQHKILKYVLITYFFTWIFWTISFTIPVLRDTFRIIGSFVPSVMSLIFILHYDGKEALKKCLKKVVAFKANPRIYIFVFLYSVITIFLPLYICNLMGQNYTINFSDSVGGFSTHSVSQIIFCLIAIAIIGGPLGEELGWRGLVLPKVQKKYNPLISAVIVGIIWTLWHIPMFYFHAEGYDNFPKYLFSTICLSIIVTWLYNKSKGSIFIVILFHTIDDYMNWICLEDLMHLFSTSNYYFITYYAIVFIFLIFISIDMMRKPVKYEG